MSKRAHDEPYGTSQKRHKQNDRTNDQHGEQESRQHRSSNTCSGSRKRQSYSSGSSPHSHAHRATGPSKSQSSGRSDTGSQQNGRSPQPKQQFSSIPSVKSSQQHVSSSKASRHELSNQRGTPQLPAPTGEMPTVPAYTPFETKDGLPALPELPPHLAKIPFNHKSTWGYDRTSTAGDMTYERLEFLGDAYLELIASRLIFARYPALTAGNQSQVRELLVKNETLSQYALAYGFEERLTLKDHSTSLGRDASGMKKILGDTVEAYVAAIVLSDTENGFAIAEKWLTALWAPKLVDHIRAHFNTTATITGQNNTKLVVQYDPTAKATLQNRVLTNETKLEYKPYRDSEELKGNQLGQNRHYIAVYLTGYGYDRMIIGRGQGKNKVEAGNWAATEALLGESKSIVEELDAKRLANKEARRLAQIAKESG